MAAAAGQNARALALFDRLERAPQVFDLFQALRRIECAFRQMPRLGEALHPADEPVRLSQEPSVAFEPSALASFTRHGAGTPRLATHAFGLLGPNGPLPLHLTEYVRDRLRNAGDPTLARFLDIFHHRILALFYRAFANSEPTACRDRPEADHFATYVGALIGLGLPSLHDRDPLPDEVKLHFAGLFALSARNAECLEAMIAAYFGLPARIEEFIGEWVDIPPGSRWRLGGDHGAGAVGNGLTLGRRIFIRDGRFRIILGPVGRGRFESFLPGAASFERLVAMVRGYVGDRLAWDAHLVLDARDWPPWPLGSAFRLGRTSWLGRVAPRRSDDVREIRIAVTPDGRSHAINEEASRGGNSSGRVVRETR